MITYTKTGETFENRKEAKEKLGREVYKKAVRERQFTFHDLRPYIPFEETTEFLDNFLSKLKNK